MLGMNIDLLIMAQETRPRDILPRCVNLQLVGFLDVVGDSDKPFEMSALVQINGYDPFHTHARGRDKQQIGFEVLIFE